MKAFIITRDLFIQAMMSLLILRPNYPSMWVRDRIRKETFSLRTWTAHVDPSSDKNYIFAMDPLQFQSIAAQVYSGFNDSNSNFDESKHHLSFTPNIPHPRRDDVVITMYPELGHWVLFHVDATNDWI